ncbi:Baculoviral IAP repeat-containing protein 5 [Aphelenchoides avenae]|nr:Baculoviral IAP repeat-containing protein 5 [Aphelenchus avenae]
MSRKGSRKPKKKALDDDKLKGMFEEIKNTELLLYKHRLASFANAWPYDRDENAVCTSQKLAEAGFFSTSSKDCKDSAKCFFCRHELLWDPQDDPMSEHREHSPKCHFLAMEKPEDSWTVKDIFKLLAHTSDLIKFEEESQSVMKDLEKLVIKTADEAESVLEEYAE